MTDNGLLQDTGMRLFANRVAHTIDLLQQYERHWLWGLGRDGDVLVLIVGNQTFLAHDQEANTIDLIVDRNLLDAVADPVIQELPRVREFKGNPSHTRVRISIDQAESLLERLSPAHEAALPLQESWFRINQRWKWHQDDIRSLLDPYLENPLPDPGYMDQWLALQEQDRTKGFGTQAPGADSPLPDTTNARYWKISPGGNGKFWPEFRDRNLIAVHFRDDMIDLGQYPDAEVDFIQKAKAVGYTHPASRMLWLFTKEMQPSDHVLAYANQSVVGFGEIIGPYLLVDDDFEYMHRHQMQWNSTVTVSTKALPQALQQKLQQQATLFELSAEEFHAATGNHAHEAYEAVDRLIIPLHEPGRRYWRVSTGTQGKLWPILRDHEILVEENWTGVTLPLDQFPSDQDSFLDAIKQVRSIGDSAALMAWNLAHGMSVGDLAIAEKNGRVQGWGIITGDYIYHQDTLISENPDSHPHRRTVNWHEIVPPRRVINQSQRLRQELGGLGTRELSRLSFEEMLGISSEPSLSSSDNFQSSTGIVGPALSARGLTYSADQITAFYTGLQTKGFVVLSGISGTGKSKIATGFVSLLPNAMATDINTLIQDQDPILFTVRPYMTKRYQIRLASKYLDRFPSFAELTTFNIPATVNGVAGTGNLRYEFMSGHPSVSIWMHKPLHQAMAQLPIDTEMILETELDDESRNLTSVKISPLLEASLSNPRPSHDSVDNHLFLSVRPDWRDSTSLLGYYNLLSSSYEWTDFLTFILRAVENYTGPAEDRIAWFVILDEMNLAHVEYYFADLLSVIESGRDTDGWTSEPLRFSYPETLEDDEVPPREVKLPPNLYIIGTVNMDETTHAFSPKVLDRAFTIELTDVSFEDYPPAITQPGNEAALGEDQKRALLRRFSRDGQFARIDKTEISMFVDGNPEVRDWLQALNTRLATYRVHFGYRVFDEIVQYLANNQIDADVPLKDAFDQAVLMKVLPKFTGSRARLEAPLQSIWQWAVEPAASSIPPMEPGTGPVFPRVADKVQLMLATLERDGFVSFG